MIYFNNGGAMEEKRYDPCDLDCNGKPYEDAVPIGSEVSALPSPSHWPFIPFSGQRIYIKSPYGQTWEISRVASVNCAVKKIYFQYPVSVRISPYKIHRFSEVYFGVREWGNGWRFSDKEL